MPAAATTRVVVVAMVAVQTKTEQMIIDISHEDEDEDRVILFLFICDDKEEGLLDIVSDPLLSVSVIIVAGLVCLLVF